MFKKPSFDKRVNFHSIYPTIYDAICRIDMDS